ncbi:MAG: ABC transporter ATP-binding protein [Anaerolineae bacterium]
MIRVEGLGKRYRIGGEPTLRALLRSPRAALQHETIWALRDVSFIVQPGEIVGVIGRNGAGKSTLLRLLGRIPAPTEGRAVLHGRAAALLEVGTGFHPDLTGRENVYLNGAILGMSRREIERKFEAIVAFAGVARFIDTPVKRYSSGMQVRLAFAVAAHLEPEILLIDEVLAVGDAAFQQKSLGRMGEAARAGRTILFVSHDMSAIAQLCSRAILLEGGHLAADGPADSVIGAYLGQTESVHIDEGVVAAQPQDAPIRIEAVAITPEAVGTGDPLTVRIHYRAAEPLAAPGFVVTLHDTLGMEVVRLSTLPISGFHIERIVGAGHIDLHIDSLPLTGGLYTLSLAVTRPRVDTLVALDRVATLRIAARDLYGSGVLLTRSRGVVPVAHRWSLHPSD